MTKTIFMTGATGFLGRRFARELAEIKAVNLLLLVRPRSGGKPEDRLADIALDRPGVRSVPGDIADTSVVADLSGLDPVDEFWHIAGLTEFHESKRPQLEQVNVEGVRHALALAERWKVSRFFHISTAYVAGICDGPVPEDGLLPNPVFRNPYEETKYRGEQLVRNSTLPWTVIRPSILMGDSVTGESYSDKMAYGVCKVYHSLAEWVQREEPDGTAAGTRRYRVCGCGDAAKNCVCIDDAVRLMLAVRERGAICKTYHCCHSQPTNMAELHAAVTRAAESPFLSLDPQPVADADRKQRFVDKGVRVYEPYMTLSDPPFQLVNVLTIAPGFRPAPMNQELLGRLFNVYIGDLRRKKHGANDTSLNLCRFDAVKKYGAFALAYNSMSRQFDAFYCDGVDGYLAYAMVDRTAMMVGDPVADKPDAILAEFVNWCDRQNHRVCALQIGHATATALRALGCCVNKIGIETSVDVRRFDLDLRGKEYQEIRNSRNVAQRLNITVREQPLAERSRAELQSLFADWLDRKKNKQELHLLLRPPSLAPEPSVRHFLAEYQGRLIAAVFFTPIYCDGRATGYYADIERYNNNNNIPTRLNWMKLIQFEAAKTFQQEGGVERIALGMSPLSCVGESEFNDNPELTALFEQLFEESELYAFKGIATHKRRYPCLDEHPVYIATRTPTAADEILDLLKGVGLLGENGAQQSASLVREARGGPRDGEP